MAAVVPVFVKKINFTNGVPGGLIGELWQIPASTAADTATVTAKFIATIIGVIGDVQHTALPLTAANTAAIITLDTVAASNFADFIILGFATP